MAAIRDTRITHLRASGYADQSALRDVVAMCESLRDERSCRKLVQCAWEALDADAIEPALVLAKSAYHLQSHSPYQALEEEDLGRLYRSAADKTDLHVPAMPAFDQTRQKLNLAHVINGLTAGNGMTEVLRNLVRHHDRKRYKLHVFVTDHTCDTLDVGLPVLEELSRTGAVVKVLRPPFQMGPAKAQGLISLLAEYKIDIAVFHTVACPVTGLTVMNRVAPLMVAFSHGDLFHHSLVDHHILQGQAGLDAAPPAIRDIATQFLLGSDFHSRLEHPCPSLVLDPFPPSSVRLGTVGSLYKMANDRFLSTVCDILDENPEAVYLFAGHGTPEELQTIHGGFAERGLERRVHHVGFLNEELADFYRSLDLVLNTFPVTGGMSVLNALAAGLPVVSLRRAERSYLDISYEYVGDDEITIPEDRPDALLAVVKRLVQEPAYRQELSERAKARYDAELRAEVITSRIDDLLWRLYREKAAGEAEARPA